MTPPVNFLRGLPEIARLTTVFPLFSAGTELDFSLSIGSTGFAVPRFDADTTHQMER
jgi:hypothetical protein